MSAGRSPETDLTPIMAAAYDFPIIAAWGAHAKPDRVAAVRAMHGADRLLALHTTKAGAPGHPLYLPASATPQPWPDQVCWPGATA